MGNKLIALLAIYLLISLTGVALANEASPPCELRGRGLGWCRNAEGDCNNRWGSCYGARQPVKNAAEARKRLEEYFADRKDVVVGEVQERRWGYEAPILNADKKVIDRVIIHRQTGRIRSIY